MSARTFRGEPGTTPLAQTGTEQSGSFELTVDRNVPVNRGLDLSKLDDILLFVSHETRTAR